MTSNVGEGTTRGPRIADQTGSALESQGDARVALDTGPFVLSREIVREDAFVDFWEGFYTYPRGHLYDRNIGQPVTPSRVRELFEWKNGGRLSRAKAASVERNFVGRIPDLQSLDDTVDAESFLRRFPEGGAIWRIYWLHLWRPARFPIYDQHVHRAMMWIETGMGQEIPARNPDKIQSYVNKYLPFVARFGGVDGRRLDRALWACGKSMKLMGAAVLGVSS